MAYDKELRPDTPGYHRVHTTERLLKDPCPQTLGVCACLCVCARVHACIVRVSGAWLPVSGNVAQRFVFTSSTVCFQTFLKDECCICFEFELLL